MIQYNTVTLQYLILTVLNTLQYLILLESAHSLYAAAQSLLRYLILQRVKAREVLKVL